MSLTAIAAAAAGTTATKTTALLKHIFNGLGKIPAAAGTVSAAASNIRKIIISKSGQQYFYSPLSPVLKMYCLW